MDMNNERNINRRTFLKTTAAGATLAAARLGSAAQQAAQQRQYQKAPGGSDEFDFLFTRVKFTCSMRTNDNWNAFPGGESNLLQRFQRIVRCKTKPVPGCNRNKPHDGGDRQFNAVVDLTDAEELRKYPFLFMTASGSYTLSKSKKKNLLQYLSEGGFIYMDDCVHGVNDDRDYFFQSSCKILDEIFGPGSVRPIPNSHEIFHSVFDLGDIGVPHLIGQPHPGHGVTIGDRLAAFLSSTDVHCGWVDNNGQWFGNGGKMGIGKHGHKEAIKMGVNIIMYALSH
jgi:hypothetical protein